MGPAQCVEICGTLQVFGMGVGLDLAFASFGGMCVFAVL